jgi:hypothetical protein
VSWLILIVGSPLATAAGYFSGLPWLLPLLQILPAYPLMVRDLKEGKLSRAVARMLLWAALIGITGEALAFRAPETGRISVIHGEAYRDEMIHWVRTGEGKESSPRRFLPEHLVHLTAFALLSLVSGSLLSLGLGAVLMNYMSFYLGSLLAVAEVPRTVLLLGWPPWAILRVVAFVILGVVLSGPVLRRLAGVRLEWSRTRIWMLAAAAGLLGDILLKTLLAPRWSEMLRTALFPLSPRF